MDINKMICYWVRSSEEDLKTARSLFTSRRYHHCLFFCHLFLEKLLKALAVKKTKKPAPYRHDLLALAELSSVRLSQEHLDILDEVTSFNISARYDNLKFQFYKKANRKYAHKYLKATEQLSKELRKNL